MLRVPLLLACALLAGIAGSPSSTEEYLVGRVVLPEGTPADERLRVTCGDALALVEADGRFRVPRTALYGQARLHARYLVLDPPVHLSLTDTELVLEPSLGARVAGRLVLSEQLDDARTASGRMPVTLELWLPDGTRDRRSTFADRNLEFSFDAVPRAELRIVVKRHGVARIAIDDLVWAPGATLEATAELAEGARLEGTLTFSSGRPVRKPVFTITKEPPRPGTWIWPAKLWRDGRFELEDLPPGRLQVQVRTRSGAGLTLPIELAEGEVREGLELTLVRSSLHGLVRDERNLPVEAFEVRVAPTSPAPRLTGDDRPAPRSFQAPDGRFALDLERGRWDLFVEADGYAPALVRGVRLPRLEELQVPLSREARLAGRVIDEAGLPLAGAVVKARTHALRAQPHVPSPSLRSETDEDGRFELDVPPGIATVRASADGYADSTLRVEPASGEELEALELVLVPHRYGALEGVAVDADGAPAPGRTVTAWSEHGQHEVETDDEGRFRLAQMPAGTWSVRLDERLTGLVSTRELGYGVEIHEGEAAFVALGARLGNVVRVRGQVAATGGTPPEDVRVRANSARYGDEARTDADGAFELELPGGRVYTFAADVDSEAGSRASSRVKAYVPEPDAGPPPTVELPLGSARIAGRVLDPDGAAATGVLVSLSMPGEPSEGEVRGFGDAKVGGNGSFAVDGLLPGTYEVVAVSEDYDDTRGFGRARATVDLDSGGTSEVTLRFSGRGALEGRVRGTRGEPVPGARVTLLDERGAPPRRSLNLFTDSAGRYFVELPPGKYWLGARTDRAAAPLLRVRVERGSVEEAEALLAPGGLLHVHVDTVDGQRIRVLDEEGLDHGLLGWEPPPASGGPAFGPPFGPLPPGTYELRWHTARATVRVEAGRVEASQIETSREAEVFLRSER